MKILFENEGKGRYSNGKLLLMFLNISKRPYKKSVPLLRLSSGEKRKRDKHKWSGLKFSFPKVGARGQYSLGVKKILLFLWPLGQLRVCTQTALKPSTS